MPTGKAGTILVVDDNEVNRVLILRQLERLGHRASAVGGGGEALRAVSASSYALVFMDCRMPGMDGLETTRRIREWEAANGHRIAIVALTANAMEGDREACLEAGMDEHIAKPVTLETLRAVLQRFVLPPPGVPERAVDDHDGGAGLEEIYLVELPDRVRAMHEAIQTNDGNALAHAAHTLKSTSALVGATALADLCGEFEAAGRRDMATGMANKLPTLDDETVRVHETLEERLAMEAGA